MVSSEGRFFVVFTYLFVYFDFHVGGNGSKKYSTEQLCMVEHIDLILCTLWCFFYLLLVRCKHFGDCRKTTCRSKNALALLV